MYLNRLFVFLLGFLVFGSSELSAQKRYALVVPYKPNEHFSDADLEIARGSGLTSGRMREIIRERLTAAVAQKISGFDSTLYFGNHTAETHDDLRKIYNAVGFRFVSSFSGKQNADADQHSRLSLKNLFKKKTGKQVSYVQNDKVIANDENTRFYEAYVVNPNLMPYISSTYQCDRLVLLSMFELKTRADLCLDKAAGIYQRELAVHYTILDKEGNFKSGDVVRMLFPSNSNDLDDILNQTLPVLSQHIAFEVR